MSEHDPAPRRHRFVTVPSGVLLAICFFLPAIEACDKPVSPYEMGFVPPYVLGLLVAALALVRPKARRIMTIVLRVLGWFGLACMVVATLTVIVDEFHPLLLVPFAVAAGLVRRCRRCPLWPVSLCCCEPRHLHRRHRMAP